MLLAEPFMADPHFKRAAILICDHHSDGSLGFILNKTVGMKIGDLITDFPEFDADVHFGGPVQTDTVHYLHRKGDLLEGSVEVVPGIYWGGNYEQLKLNIEGGLIEPADVKFYVGYTGWSEGQLAEELEYLSWMTSEVDRNYVFKEHDDTLWKEALEHAGDSYSVIAQMPLPNWN